MITDAREAEELAALWEDATPEQVVAGVLERLADRSMVLTTSFGMEGCALLDMFAAHGRPLTVVYLDTGLWFEETHQLRERMAARYPHLTFVDRGPRLTLEAQAERFGPELWRRDPDRCCYLRKVKPMADALAGADVWVTALMRSQSPTRAGIQVVSWNDQYRLLQVCPLANWDRRMVWAYVQAHEVPYNELHERGYPTVGCTPCTRPVEGAGVASYSRAGRWAGFQKTECGLHFNGSARHGEASR